jgi:hypothetical protein
MKQSMSFGRNKAQIIGEYAITIAVVVSVLTAMTIYVRRTLQARVYDTEQTMVNVVDMMSRGISGGSISIKEEYEPYYGDSHSDVNQDIDENTELLPGGTTGIFRKTVNAETTSHTTSTQLPPSQSR